MVSFRVDLEDAGIRAFLGDDDVKNEIRRMVNSVSAAAGSPDDYPADVTRGKKDGRWRGSVYTATVEAKRAEAADRTLSRAINAVRQ